MLLKKSTIVAQAPRPAGVFRSVLLHLLHMLLIKNLLHADELDHALGLLEERSALGLGIAGESEGDKEPRWRSSRCMTASKASMSGRPTLSVCLT